VQGRLVRMLLDQAMTRGAHSFWWDGRNDNGMQVGAGIYLLRLQQGGTTSVVRIVLLH